MVPVDSGFLQVTVQIDAEIQQRDVCFHILQVGWIFSLTEM